MTARPGGAILAPISGVRAVETILDFAFQLYRAAQDLPLEDFEALALGILKALIPFCAAIWFAAVYERDRLDILRSRLHGLPPETLQLLAAQSKPLCRAVGIALQAPRQAHSFHVRDLCHDPADGATLSLARREHLERQLLIADAASTAAPVNCLALYRSEAERAFDERDRRMLTLCMPHISQALAINHRIHPATGVGAAAQQGGAWAVIRADGTLIHCGDRLIRSLRAKYPAWDGVALPRDLLARLKSSEDVELLPDARLHARRMGSAMLLALHEVAPTGRLTRRELEVAQLFGAGASYKQIARQAAIAPATVRNVVQNTYRKLQINNKAQLARLMADLRWRELTRVPPMAQS
jgi:DNA-binding CsgD family transcriptional regulator